MLAESFIDRRAVHRVLMPGAVALFTAFAAASFAQARPSSSTFADIAAKAGAAVVNITVEGGGPDHATQRPGAPFAESPFREFMDRFFGRRTPGFDIPMPMPPHGYARGAGSGFIVDPTGYVVTNNHVVAGGGKVRVRLRDGAAFEARLIGGDDRTDLALLKIDAGRALPFVRFGDSDRVRAGDWVMTIGNPFGLGGTVTAGVVSARGRDLPGGPLVDFLQIDAPINRGSSGGPAFDEEGNVIGVNTAIFSPNGGNVGIGFAIPSNTAKTVVAALRADGKIERGWLGVHVQPLTQDLAKHLGLQAAAGALVASVLADGPAAKAGLAEGDVITKWDGKTVQRTRDLPRLVASTPIGKSVTIEVIRAGKTRSFAVETGRIPTPKKIAAEG